MFALQPLQHFLLGLLGSQPTDAFGQGGSGVARDDAQMTFQRSKGWLVVVASVLERISYKQRCSWMVPNRVAMPPLLSVL